MVAVHLDAVAGNGLAGLRDAFRHALRPALLDADNHHRGDVGVGAGADQGAEMQLQVRSELEPAIGVRNRHSPLDVVRNRFGRRVREVVDRKDDHMVAHAHPAVLAPVAPERRICQIHCHKVASYQRFVLML